MAQKESGDESTSLQSIRSLIERVFRRLKLWTGACDFTISPHTRETVQAHYNKIEMDLDCIVAFENLKLLCESDRVATIPRKPHRGAIYARLNDLKIQPDLKIPKLLPADMGNWSVHLRSFWLTFSGIAPDLAKEIGTKRKKAAVPAAGPALCTVNVLRRGANLVQSGYVSLFSVGADPDNDASVMVIAKVCVLGGPPDVTGQCSACFCVQLRQWVRFLFCLLFSDQLLPVRVSARTVMQRVNSWWSCLLPPTL